MSGEGGDAVAVIVELHATQTRTEILQLRFISLVDKRKWSGLTAQCWLIIHVKSLLVMQDTLPMQLLPL